MRPVMNSYYNRRWNVGHQRSPLAPPDVEKCERGRDGPRTQSMERHQLKRPALNKHQLVKTVLIKGIIIMLYRDLSCPDLDSWRASLIIGRRAFHLVAGRFLNYLFTSAIILHATGRKLLRSYGRRVVKRKICYLLTVKNYLNVFFAFQKKSIRLN